MALVRKTRFCSNLGEAEFSIANQFDRPSQPQMNDGDGLTRRSG
jgi:hypothetical protein